MINRVHTAFITFLVATTTLASSQAFGGSGPIPAPAQSIFRPSVTRSPHQHNRRDIGTFFPGVGGFFWGQPNGQPNVDVTQTIAGGLYTCTYDLPWDWVHRCPPSFFASPPEPPPPPVMYAPGCAAQTVTVPGADGKDQTVSMLRC